ncbi:MAG: outer membrane protein transport protein [Pseudolabrys sp.]|nr:outer membrane protein transport protein [Pseudolabrys sp.]
MTRVKGRIRALLLSGASVGLLMAATAAANAGGFALREQSAYGQGASFAGIAAGGALSSMFWNPATMTQQKGLQFEQIFTGIMPYASHSPNATSTFAAFGAAGDSGDDAVVPAGYFSWQATERLWLGMSINSPFGLSVSFPDRWAGRTYAENTFLRTYNFTPTVAFELNNWISFGAGVQIQYATAGFTSGLPVNNAGVTGLASLTNTSNLQLNGWGYGFVAGVTLTPTPTTTIGIGYRSAINQKADGTLTLPAGGIFAAPFSNTGAVETTLHLPDSVTVGLRQRLSKQWTLLAGFEWSNWSRIGTSAVTLASTGAPATVVGNAVTIPFEYKDGYFYSLGAEYDWNERLTLRSGIAFEKSPIVDQVRTPRLPDNDRFWLSAGLTYKLTPKLSLDAAYTHIFVKDTSVALGPGTGNPSSSTTVSYSGSIDAHVDIVSLGIRYRFDDPATPVRQVYTK